MPNHDDGLLEEYRAFREEHSEVQKARLWGSVPYLIIAGGAVALKNPSWQPILFLLVIFSAVPFLWHMANRERSLNRIAAYIAVVIEPRLRGRGWYAHLSQWQQDEDHQPVGQRVRDYLRYMFGLTGVYVVIVIFSFAALVISRAHPLYTVTGVVGLALCVEAHWYLYRIHTSPRRYRDRFRKINEDLAKMDPCT